MTWLELAALILGAYLLGSVHIAYYIARHARNIDLRKHGTGNVGMSNLARATSKRLAIPVLIFDLAKGIAPVLVARWLGFDALAQGAVGMAAVTGHCWPVWLHFQGGRGVLTLVGVMVAITPWLTLAAVGFAFMFIPFRQLALGAVLAVALFILVSWLVYHSVGTTLAVAGVFVLMVVRRLSVPRAEIAKGLGTGEVMWNRLLFDRDIRDRAVWINRGHSSMN